MANFVTREDLEGKIGAERVRQLFDDDRDGVLNDDEVAKLNEVLSEANDTTISILLQKAWSLDQLDTLSADRALRRATMQIALQIAGERRPEFTNDSDEGPFEKMGQRGMAVLKSFAKGDQRSRLEQAAGANKGLRGRYSASTPNTIFGRDPSNPDDHLGDDKGF